MEHTTKQVLDPCDVSGMKLAADVRMVTAGCEGMVGDSKCFTQYQSDSR